MHYLSYGALESTYGIRLQLRYDHEREMRLLSWFVAYLIYSCPPSSNREFSPTPHLTIACMDPTQRNKMKVLCLDQARSPMSVVITRYITALIYDIILLKANF